MDRRVDYFDDPSAPEANSLKPSAAALVVYKNRVLLIKRSDNGNWSMPGGAQDLGESLTQTVIRETLEESGIRVRPTGVVGIYTDPRHVVQYTSNNEVRQEFTIVYRAEYMSGDPTPSRESDEVHWVDANDVATLLMDRSQRMRISWGLSHDKTWIDPPPEHYGHGLD